VGNKWQEVVADVVSYNLSNKFTHIYWATTTLNAQKHLCSTIIRQPDPSTKHVDAGDAEVSIAYNIIPLYTGPVSKLLRGLEALLNPGMYSFCELFRTVAHLVVEGPLHLNKGLIAAGGPLHQGERSHMGHDPILRIVKHQ